MKLFKNVKIVRGAAFVAVAICASLPVFAAKTVSENITLAADADWRADGVVTVPEGVMVDLNGHTLWVSGLAGKGAFTSSVANPVTFDLTTKQTNDTRVKSYTGGTDQALGTAFTFTSQPAWKLFADYDSYSNSKRAITAFTNGTSDPVDIVYEFDAATAVNSYNIQVTSADSYLKRSPRTWKFFGSVTGEDDTWVELDAQTDVTDWTRYEQRPFTFFNDTAYKFYRLRIIQAHGNDTVLEFFKLEYGRVQNQLRIAPSQDGGFTSASNTVSGTAKFVVAGGALAANADLRGLGKISVAPRETLDLAGYYLRVYAIDGAARVTTSVTSTFADLTDPTDAKTCATATSAGTVLVMAGENKYPASAAFDDSLSTSTSGSTANPCHFAYYTSFPSAGIEINYDFGAATYVNTYKICGTCTSGYSVPKTWAFQGSNDGVTWTTLDERVNQALPFGEYATYTFISDKSYSRYRLHTTAVTVNRFYLWELQYGAVSYNTIYVDADGIAESDFSGIALSDGVTVALPEGEALVLADDLDLSGFAIDGTIDLNGHTLTVDRLEGDGTITDTTSMLDLTDSDASRVRAPGTTFWASNAGEAKDAFSNQIEPTLTGIRVMVEGQLPVAIDYDFRVATIVDMYRLTAGDNKDRGPASWEIFGSNDDAAFDSGKNDLSAWKRLDTRFDETWSAKFETRNFSFANSTPYRYYRIRFTKSNNTFLTFWKLQYGCSANCGHLRVVVPNGSTIDNKTVALTGNLRFVKDGDGTLVVTKTGQSYRGGTEVAGGTLKAGCDGTSHPFGAKGGDIVVAAGATLGLNNWTQFQDYGFTLAGGTLDYTGADDNGNKAVLSRVRLVDDSTMTLHNSYGFRGTATSTPTLLDLGGCTLNLVITSGKYCYLNSTTILSGMIVTSNSGWFYPCGDYVTATDVDFKINCALSVGSPFAVNGYEAGFSSATSNSGTEQMSVAGVFKPMVAAYYGCTMLAGSTMDLTAWPGAWPMASAFGANGKTDLEFADSGEITVKLAGRTDLKALAESEDPHLFTWPVTDGVPVVPGAEFTLDPDTASAGFKVKKDETGLRLVYDGGFMLIIK